MGRLLKALVVAAAATGATYLVLHALGQAETARSAGRRTGLVDEDELTQEEKQELLRELGAYL